MVKGMLTLAAGFCLACVAQADVKVVTPGPTVDGKLDDACWKKAVWLSDFQAKLSNPNKTIRNQTAFAIVSDRRNVYIGFRCDEANMAGVRNEPLGSLWTMNQINLFLAPSGNGFNFYQFAFSPTHGLRASHAYSEGGNIHCEPDYLPDWEVKTDLGTKGWTAEVRIPVNAFYHTPTDEWKGEWLVNVGRVRKAGDEVEKSSWSPVQDVFPDPKAFRPVAGFPPRHWRDDVALTDVQFVPSGVANGRVVGVLSANLRLRARGDFTLKSAVADAPLAFKRLKGDGIVRLPASFKENGAYTVDLELERRLEDGTLWPLVYRREAKVRVDFRPVDVRFTRPAYRANFYPGQDSSAVEGTVSVAAGGEVGVEIEGPGIPRQRTVLKGAAGAPQPFSFATPGFAEGTATVTVTSGGERQTFAVRKLAKSAHRMAWVENGKLVVDGAPVFSRKVAHAGYRVSAWTREIFATNSLNETGIIGARNLEARRLVPGSEPREGTKDQAPSAEVLAAIDRQMDAVKDEDFVYYYLCDEPECRRVSPVYLKHLYDHVTARDPYHVIRIGTRAPKRYLDCCDWFETHPYINPQNLPDGRRVYGRPINTIGDFVSEIADLKRPDKVIGFYTSAFAYTYKNPQSDYPTFDEYVTHCWAGLVRGAKTLICYAYHDVHDRPAVTEGVRFTFAQVAALEPFLLDGRRRSLEKDADHEKVKYELNGETLVVSVDFKALRVTFEAPEKYLSRLPSYEATKRLVDAEEESRTHTGNLLFGHWQEVRTFGTGGKQNRYKLYDGVRWNYANLVRSKNPNHIGVEFTKFKPSFSSVALWGNKIKSARLQVREGKDWKDVATGTPDGVWCMRFALPAPIAPEAIRIVLPRGALELYELEVR